MPSLTLDIKPEGRLHKVICDEVQDRVRFSKNKFGEQHKKWKRAEEAALAFLPEKDVDAARRLDREEGGQPQYTTIVVPYSYAILMASHTYWTTVFMGRSPVFQFSGRHGEGEQQVQAMEALIDYQLQVGEMLVPLYLWLMDVGKYGMGVIGTYWDQRLERVSQIIEVPRTVAGIPIPGTGRKKRGTIDIPGYAGNTLYNVRPLDFLPDPRVPVHRFQEGEYCNIYRELGWNEVKRRKEQGFYTNLDRLEPGDRGSSHEREVGSPQLTLPENTDPFFGSTQGKRNSDIVKLYECYIELTPSEWGLGKGDRSEKWVFTVTADFKTVIGAQPLGALHNKFPFQVLEYEPEAYAIVNRGIPDILDPIQRTIDWLVNVHFYNVRKTVNNQFVVDPSRVVMKDVTDPKAGKIIRLKPSAYGTNTAEAVTQLRVEDVTQNNIRDLQMMLNLGERTLGVNDQILGALNAGGRKTATEVRASSTFGISRLKTVSEYFSAMGWGPLAQMLVQNSQQYYEGERKFRIVGDLALEAGPNFAEVTPDALVGFYDFMPVDGTLPVDRFAQANLWRELLTQMARVPPVMAQYDLGRIFAWVAQLAGLKNIHQFRVQVQPDAQVQQQAQAGNVVPLGGGAAPSPASSGPDQAGVPEPGQVSGLGATG